MPPKIRKDPAPQHPNGSWPGRTGRPHLGPPAADGGAPRSAMSCACSALRYPLCDDLQRLPTGANGECDFSLAEHTEYLPAPEVLACSATKEFQHEWSRDAARMRAVAHALQRPRSCGSPLSADTTESGFAEGQFPNGEPMWRDRPDEDVGFGGTPQWVLGKWARHGHGANMMLLMFLAGSLWDRGAPMMLSSMPYRFGDACGANWSCFLSPRLFSQCTVGNTPWSRINVYPVHVGHANLLVTLEDACKPHGSYHEPSGLCDCDPGYQPSMQPRVPFCEPRDAPRGADGPNWDVSRDMVGGAVAFLEERHGRKRPQAYTDYASIAQDFRTSIVLSTAPGTDNPETMNTHSGKLWAFRYPSLRLRHGWLWWISVIAQIFHEDAPAQRALAAYAEEKVGPAGDCVAVHVRHGDVCTEAGVEAVKRSCEPLSTYLGHVARLEALYGRVEAVYVMSDDQSIIDAVAREAETDGRFRWQAGVDRRKYDTRAGKDNVDENAELNGAATLEELYRDIYAASRCRALVGSGSSGLTILIYALMVARSMQYPPFISVDVPLFQRDLFYGRMNWHNFADGTCRGKGADFFCHGADWDSRLRAPPVERLVGEELIEADRDGRPPRRFWKTSAR